MQERDKDELADALSRMASGDAAEEDSIQSAAPEQAGAAEAVPRTAAPLFRSDQSEQTSSSTPPRPVQSAPAPRVRPAAPKMRPASPNLTTPAPDRSIHSVMPATARSRTATRPSGPPPLYRRLSFRRTMIPILLTLGVMLSALGTLPLLVSADSPLAAMPNGPAITFIVVGLALLAAAIVNMIQVRHELRSA